MVLNAGDKVKIEYTGTFENGEVFDSSENHGKPLEFEIGAGMVIKGFEDAVMNLNLNDEVEITIKPEEAYGNVNPELFKEVPKNEIAGEDNVDIEPGMMLAVGLPNGQQFPATVKEVKEDIIVIDLNHPLAGKTLNFKIKLVAINDPNSDLDECECDHEHTDCECGHDHDDMDSSEDDLLDELKE